MGQSQKPATMVIHQLWHFVCGSSLPTSCWDMGGLLKHQQVRKVIASLFFFFLLLNCLIPNKGNSRKSHNAVRSRQDFVSTPQLLPPIISADKSLQISHGEEGARPLSCPKPTVLERERGEGSGGQAVEQAMCWPSRNPRATGEPGKAGKTIGS